MMETKPGIGLAYANVCVSVRVRALVETEEKKVNMNRKQYVEMKRKKRDERREKGSIPIFMYIRMHVSKETSTPLQSDSDPKRETGSRFVKKDEKRMRNEAKEGAKKVREPFSQKVLYSKIITKNEKEN